MATTGEKQGWYPGKYARRASTVKKSGNDDNEEADRGSLDRRSLDGSQEHWYPGKYISKLAGKNPTPNSEDEEKNPTGTAKSSIQQQNADFNKLDVLGRDATCSASDDKRPTIGKVRLQIHQAKYCNFAQASVLVQLDNATCYHDVSPSPPTQQIQEIQLDLISNLSIKAFPSDVVITVNGKTSQKNASNVADANPVGVAILPLVRYCSLFGTPMKPSLQWVQYIPLFSGMTIMP